MIIYTILERGDVKEQKDCFEVSSRLKVADFFKQYIISSFEDFLLYPQSINNVHVWKPMYLNLTLKQLKQEIGLESSTHLIFSKFVRRILAPDHKSNEFIDI